MIIWIRDHWKAVLIPVGVACSAIITKAIDQYFDLGWLGDLAGWIVAACAIIWAGLISPVTMPVWLIVLLAALAALAATWLKRTHSKLAVATAELDELKNPSKIELEFDQHAAVFWLAALREHYGSGKGILVDDLASWMNVPIVTVEAVVDVLRRQQMLVRSLRTNAPLELTAKGREYLMQPIVREDFARFMERRTGTWQGGALSD
ncbi:hypothetical protein HNE05_07615 [Aquipseudomonas campi]|uniref:Uncharacterized protein n=1 Tax=Aquipseudomonas campi TaxID=2731681 RepID=A0A6M8FGF1_9GAMM|nr:hypothetical protein [Pseudomonas campi]QKE63230.1 hypothetical protein HNE05_07615 [Pseudomonas campi]